MLFNIKMIVVRREVTDSRIRTMTKGEGMDEWSEVRWREWCNLVWSMSDQEVAALMSAFAAICTDAMPVFTLKMALWAIILRVRDWVKQSIHL